MEEEIKKINLLIDLLRGDADVEDTQFLVDFLLKEREKREK